MQAEELFSLITSKRQGLAAGRRCQETIVTSPRAEASTHITSAQTYDRPARMLSNESPPMRV